MIVAFTGHRPDKLGGYESDGASIRARIRAALQHFKPTKAISGMALGVDQWAAREALDLGIPVVAAVPFAGQEDVWPMFSRLNYRNLIKRCAEVVTVSPGGYTREKMLDRNRWMVDRCDVLIAVWDGSGGGTAHCYHYAKSVGRKIARIDPRATS